MTAHTVLVIEDSPTMRQLMSLALRRLPGLSLVAASNGAEALERMAEVEFDLILLDLNMPVMGGFTFLEHLATRATRPPVIVITTEGDAADRERAASFGVAAYVTKPLRANDLASAVTKILGA
ncbi:MAG: response regulator [Deltaproteobacteria bacterium]|nr:response regulator [Deltaproteobacteria bacterium]